jgi:hypothetical protein
VTIAQVNALIVLKFCVRFEWREKTYSTLNIPMMLT